MRGVGRRGSTNWMYEIVMSLILLALFAVTVFLYINANASGAAYYSKVYAEDLATSADIVAAGGGDVLLRHDNLKPNLDLGFFLTNGRVAVAPIPESELESAFGIAGFTTTRRQSFAEPPNAIVRFYGGVRSYSQPDALINPTYLALRKVGKSFSITPADVIMDDCPSDAPETPLSDVKVALTVDGLNDEESRRAMQAFASSLPKGIPIVAEHLATASVTIARSAGENSMSVSPSGNDGQQFACLYWRHYSLLSLSEFPRPDLHAGSGFDLTITVTTDADTLVRPEHLGQAAALALARMYG